MPSLSYRNYIKHLQSIIQFFEDAPKTSEGWLYDAIAHGILARSETAVMRICPEGSPYRDWMAKALHSSSQERVQADRVVGIVRALKGDLEDGYLESLSELVRGEMFENLIEMATHLMNEGYKDAAAVIAGSSLESHLRQLCIKHGLQIAQDGTIKHKKAEQLNQLLRKEGVYTLFDQKQITAWLDLRNNAAHGNYSQYSEDQVAKLIEWVGDFISKNPA